MSFGKLRAMPFEQLSPGYLALFDLVLGGFIEALTFAVLFATA
jgi:hypothetical protein